MSDKIWKEGHCIRCGLNQNCLIETIKDSPISFWKCIYCDELHTLRKLLKPFKKKVIIAKDGSSASIIRRPPFANSSINEKGKGK